MRRLICLGAASLMLMTACSLLPTGSSPPTAAPTSAPTAAPTVAPTVARAPASPTAAAAPKPTNTPESPAASDKVWVGNTDGEGVYIRKTPVMDDKVRAYPDGTELTVIGDDVDGDGQHWKNVRTPDGVEGYVPSIYTTDMPP